MTVSDLLEQPCNPDNINKMKASCILVDNLGQAVRTLVDGLLADLQQGERFLRV